MKFKNIVGFFISLSVIIAMNVTGVFAIEKTTNNLTPVTRNANQGVMTDNGDGTYTHQTVLGNDYSSWYIKASQVYTFSETAEEKYVRISADIETVNGGTKNEIALLSDKGDTNERNANNTQLAGKQQLDVIAELRTGKVYIYFDGSLKSESSKLKEKGSFGGLIMYSYFDKTKTAKYIFSKVTETVYSSDVSLDDVTFDMLDDVITEESTAENNGIPSGLTNWSVTNTYNAETDTVTVTDTAEGIGRFTPLAASIKVGEQKSHAGLYHFTTYWTTTAQDDSAYYIINIGNSSVYNTQNVSASVGNKYANAQVKLNTEYRIDVVIDTNNASSPKSYIYRDGVLFEEADLAGTELAGQSVYASIRIIDALAYKGEFRKTKAVVYKKGVKTAADIASQIEEEIRMGDMYVIISDPKVKCDEDVIKVTADFKGDDGNTDKYVAGYDQSGNLIFAVDSSAAAEGIAGVADKIATVKLFAWIKGSQKPAAFACEVDSESFNMAGVPGKLLNVRSGGSTTTTVYGVPSVGVPLIDLYSEYFAADGTLNEKYADYTSEDLKADLENPLINPMIADSNAYASYNDRLLKNEWRLTNGVYGDQYRFAVAQQDSVLVGKKVTRLFKPSTDPQTYPHKAYEFELSKGGTVYITVPGKSEYIEGLNKGWIYESNSAKYNVKHAGYKKVTLSNKSGVDEQIYIPTASTVDSPFPKKHVSAYYMHFNAGDLVEIPVFDTTQSYYETLVYVVWDDCNDGYGIFGAEYMLGEETVAIDEFEPDKDEYTITVPVDTTDVPQVNLIATAGSEAVVTAPDSFDENGCAVVTVSAYTSEGVRNTYKFSFYRTIPEEKDTSLKAICFDDVAIEEFNKYIKEYDIQLPYGSEYPLVSVQTNSTGATYNIVQPTEGNGGKCTITVTSKDGSYSDKYILNITILDYIPLSGQIMPIKDNRKSIVTIVHDDGDLSTVRFMNSEFEETELKATIAMIAKNVSTSNKAAWQACLDTGRFNIANHSYNHTYWGQTDEAESGIINGNAFSIPAGTMTKEIVSSGDHLRTMFPNEKVRCFVKPGFLYPTGLKQVSDTAKAMIKENYIAMRNTGGMYLGATGLNSIKPDDYYNLHSLMVSYNDTVSSWKALTDKAIANNAWAVYLFHGIFNDADNNENGVPKSKASELFKYIAEKSATKDVWCALLDEAVMYTQEVQTARALVKDYIQTGGNSIKVQVTDELDDSLYDTPVTVKVQVPQSWKTVLLMQEGRTEEIEAFEENGVTYVYANVVPDLADAVLTMSE